MKTIINISGYKFIELSDLEQIQAQLRAILAPLDLKGTILLSTEGINILLAGESNDIGAFKAYLKTQLQFADIFFKTSISDTVPFKRCLVKIKLEIITLKQADIHPQQDTVPHLSPKRFKQWLDEGRDITVLDTRNDYEIEYGTFESAVNLHIGEFTEFPKATQQLDDVAKEKPLVIFCTGGVRCEKAGPVMTKQGFKEVYQLDGGILNYFVECGQAHYQGECFVFDERISLTAEQTIA